MVHAVMEAVQPGDVVVLTMPQFEPVAMLGDLLATQAHARGAAAVLVDGAVRDVEELAEIGLPVWARAISIRGASKTAVGAINQPVTVGGQPIAPGDTVVLDADGAAVIPAADVERVTAAALDREERERQKRELLRGGALSYDLDGLRDVVERGE
jgi:4-hydroxy-4-methyl-2-oxoglutarate aldolase